MRAVVLVLVMFLVALVSGMSFVVRAGAQPATPTASAPTTAQFAFDCGSGETPRTLPSGAPVLISCTATATNTGAESLLGTTIMFEQASVGLAPPDRYCFFSATHDGVDVPVGCNDLSYSFGDIGPGARSEILLRIIVATTHEYGADVVLRDGAGREYARTTVHGLVGEAPALPLTLKFVPRTADKNGYTGSSEAVFSLYAANLMADQAYDDVTVEMADSALAADVTRVVSPAWTENASGHLVSDLGPLAAGVEVEREVTFALTAPNTGVCNYVNPVVVLNARRGGATETAVAMADGVTIGACVPQAAGDGPVALPSTGSRTEPDAGLRRIAVLAFAAGVGACLAGIARRPTARRKARS
jgi:hypothetical protein